MKRRILILIASLLACTGCTMHHHPHASDEGTASAASLDQLKDLAGHWSGKSSDGEPVDVIYRTTSGGTAVEETLFPGTDHEMVSMYYMNGGSIEMTHYCMIGNQPVLRSTFASPGEIDFQFVGGTNLTPGKGRYMSSLKLSFYKDGHIQQEWGGTDNGQENSKNTVMELWPSHGCPAHGCPLHGCSAKAKCNDKKGCPWAKNGQNGHKHCKHCRHRGK